MTKMTKQEYVHELQRLVKENPDQNITRDWLRKHSKISEAGWRKRFKSFTNFKKSAGISEDRMHVIGGSKKAPDTTRAIAQGDAFIFTSAQSNTFVFEEFFKALENFAQGYNAQIHVSQYTYNKATYGKKSVKPGTLRKKDFDDIWFDPVVQPYASNESMEITPDLIWCGELNVIPTRQMPLSSLKSYTRQASGIVPHAKMHMESIATMKHEKARFMYTTGTCTQRNYIQKLAGQVADFHHVFGALFVQKDDQGNWWATQLNADQSGGFYYRDEYWTETGVSEGHRVAAITHGDLHFEKRDDEILNNMFEVGGIVDHLRPMEQYFHDTVDFTQRNHHNIKDPHFIHDQYIQGREKVEAEFQDAADWLVQAAYRDYSDHYLITSNHDQAIEGWLRNPVGMHDAPNMKLWHQLNAYCCEEREQRRKPRPFMKLMQDSFGEDKSKFTIIHEDESKMIIGTDIEAALHGHLGPNGARGNPKNLRNNGKANTAHTHTAGIIDGIYTAGVFGSLDMGYNKGLSSWSHSFIVTYQNGKRAIFTIKAGKAWK